MKSNSANLSFFCASDERASIAKQKDKECFMNLQNVNLTFFTKSIEILRNELWYLLSKNSYCGLDDDNSLAELMISVKKV